ncbi:MAG: hypothetical protein IPN80_09765 [Flavobacterium sp.]|nr:hypothetical protein [Flavobacterium sp.]
MTQPSLTADITSTPAPLINSLLTASAVYGEVAATYTITASNRLHHTTQLVYQLV